MWRKGLSTRNDCPYCGYAFTYQEYLEYGHTVANTITEPSKITDTENKVNIEPVSFTCDGPLDLTHATIPDGVIGIDFWAFMDGSSLSSVTIPRAVISICELVFKGCKRLKCVYYKGSLEDWKKISKGSKNRALKKATRSYFSESNPYKNNSNDTTNYWHEVNGKPVVWRKDN